MGKSGSKKRRKKKYKPPSMFEVALARFVQDECPYCGRPLVNGVCLKPSLSPVKRKLLSRHS